MSKPKNHRQRAKRKSAVVSSELVLPLLNLGAQMANICFNLKQDETIQSNTRRVMGELQTKWDAARRTVDEELERLNAPGERPATD